MEVCDTSALPTLRASFASAGLARTLFMEQHRKFAASIDLQAAAAPVPAAALAAVLGSAGEFAVAMRGGRSYSLRLSRGALPRARAEGPIRSALVTGGSKVGRPHGSGGSAVERLRQDARRGAHQQQPADST